MSHSWLTRQSRVLISWSIVSYSGNLRVSVSEDVGVPFNHGCEYSRAPISSYGSGDDVSAMADLGVFLNDYRGVCRDCLYLMLVSI